MQTDARVALAGARVSSTPLQWSPKAAQAIKNALKGFANDNARAAFKADLSILETSGSTRFHYTSPDTTGAIEALKREGCIRPVDGKPGRYERT